VQAYRAHRYRIVTANCLDVVSPGGHHAPVEKRYAIVMKFPITGPAGKFCQCAQTGTGVGQDQPQRRPLVTM
jgi:hypothetical protein